MDRAIWVRLRSVLDRKPDATTVTLNRESAEEMLAEIKRLHENIRAEALDMLHGTPCAQIRWQQERETLEAEIARLTAMLAPKPLDENAPKDRELIGVERPPYEDRTYYRMIEWRENEQRWMTKCGVDWATRQYIWAFCGVTHYLDPQELPGLPYSDGSDIEGDEWDEEEQP